MLCVSSSLGYWRKVFDELTCFFKCNHTAKYNENGHNNPDFIFEMEKQKKRERINKVNPSINSKQTNCPNKTLKRFKEGCMSVQLVKGFSEGAQSS